MGEDGASADEVARSQCAAAFGSNGQRWTVAGLSWCEVSLGQRSYGFGELAPAGALVLCTYADVCAGWCRKQDHVAVKIWHEEAEGSLILRAAVCLRCTNTIAWAASDGKSGYAREGRGYHVLGVHRDIRELFCCSGMLKKVVRLTGIGLLRLATQQNEYA